MLVTLTDIKGRTYYVNHVYVRVVQTNKKGQTEVCLTFGGTSWASTHTAIVVNDSAESVVAMLNASMPLSFDVAPAIAGDDDAAAAAAAAAASTAG